MSDIASLVVLILLLASAGLGLITGLFKGFASMRTWANEYVFATLCTIVVSLLLKSNVPELESLTGLVVIGSAIVFILIFTLFSKIFREIFSKKLARRIDAGEKGGLLGAVNRLWGGLCYALKYCTFTAILLAIALTVVDLSGIAVIKEYLAEFYAGDIWLTVKPYIFDFLVVGLLQLAMKHGFTGGIVSAVWSFVVLGLVVLAGYLAYNFAFNVEAFNGAAEGISAQLDNMLAESGVLGMLGLETITLSRWLLTVGLFLLFSIVVFLIAKFVPRLLHFARMGTAFYVVDGVFGAFVWLVIVLAIMLVIGNVIEPLQGMEFMLPFDEYFNGALIANYVYTDNILASFGIINILPLSEWLAPAAQ